MCNDLWTGSNCDSKCNAFKIIIILICGECCCMRFYFTMLVVCEVHNTLILVLTKYGKGI